VTLLKHKVLAYITHGERLLIFSHPDAPEAGLQVPAGTLEPGEDPAAGVMREAFEETGLSGLRLNAFLGEYDQEFPALGAVHHRRFYHLICEETPPERWIHYEWHPSDGSPAPIRFEFFWVPLPDGVPELVSGHGRMLPGLIALLLSETAQATSENVLEQFRNVALPAAQLRPDSVGVSPPTSLSTSGPEIHRSPCSTHTF